MTLLFGVGQFDHQTFHDAKFDGNCLNPIRLSEIPTRFPTLQRVLNLFAKLMPSGHRTELPHRYVAVLRRAPPQLATLVSDERATHWTSVIAVRHRGRMSGIDPVCPGLQR